MNEVKKISSLEQMTVLFLGLLIALFAVASPYQGQFINQVAEIVQQNEVDADSQDESPADQQIVQSIDAVPHAFHLPGLHGIYGTVKDFVFNTDPDTEERTPLISQSTSKLFKTLFRYIISPNAP